MQVAADLSARNVRCGTRLWRAKVVLLPTPTAERSTQAGIASPTRVGHNRRAAPSAAAGGAVPYE